MLQNQKGMDDVLFVVSRLPSLAAALDLQKGNMVGPAIYK